MAYVKERHPEVTQILGDFKFKRKKTNQCLAEAVLHQRGQCLAEAVLHQKRLERAVVALNA